MDEFEACDIAAAAAADDDDDDASGSDVMCS